MKKVTSQITSGICAVCAIVLTTSDSARAQGTSTNDYSKIQPFPNGLTLSTQPSEIGGDSHSLPTFLNISLGTNGSGQATNQVMPGTTNFFTPANAAFNCADYDFVQFQFVAQVSNTAPTFLLTLPLALSQDNSNYDAIVDPIVISVNTALTNRSGYLIVRTNIPTMGARSIALYSAGLPTPSPGTNTYLTNAMAFFTPGPVTKKSFSPDWENQ